MTPKQIKFFKGIVYPRYAKYTGFELLEVDEIIKSKVSQKSFKDYGLEELQALKIVLGQMFEDIGKDYEIEFEDYYEVKR
jgi:hypothetical protein